MSIGSQQEIGAARRVSQKQLQICSQEDSAAEEEARARRRNNRGATYISATHEGGQRRLSHAKQQGGDEWEEYKAQIADSLVTFIEHVCEFLLLLSFCFLFLFFKERGWCLSERRL